jgi:hypothetical protein
MAAAKSTTRLRALELAVASSHEEDAPMDVVERAQIYSDWIDAKITLPLRYDFKEEPQVDDANVLPLVKPTKAH